MTYTDLTLCIISNADSVLLGMKKRGFGKGNYNGFGGKLHAGEAPRAGAIRECEEEAHIQLIDPVYRGQLFFSSEAHTERLRVFLYHASIFSGTPEETEEMRPQWFPRSAIPYSQMWADDVHWLPRILAGNHIRGHFHFATDHQMLWFEVHQLPDAFML